VLEIDTDILTDKELEFNECLVGTVA